jgi:hypothetical protein
MLGGCLGMFRNVYTVQTIRQAYKVNSKSVRLSTGWGCGDVDLQLAVPGTNNTVSRCGS